MTNLESLASNLVAGPEGILTTPLHRDAGFRYGDDIDWLAVETESFWYRHRNRCFETLVRRFPPQGALFEVGSGNGSVALALQAMGIDLVAIEPTLKDAITSRRRGVSRVICANLEEAGFGEHTLANLGLFDVLEHIEDDLAFLRTLRRFIKPGGYFYCATPAWNQLWSAEDTAGGHFRRYNLGTLTRRCGAAGFRVAYTSYFFAPLVLPLFLFRTLPSLLRLRRRPTSSRTSREHHLPAGMLGRFLQSSLDAEAEKLGRGDRSLIGTSCLLVAQAV
jgi:SAM-dependent methyltransferase